MRSFKDFGIEIKHQSFIGDSIKIGKILNREITVLDFKLEESKFKGKCLYLQIEYKDTKHVVFTGAAGLIEAIQQVPSEGFPFTTTIIEENDRYEFT